MGCDRAQGFLYAPAVPASQAERFLPRGGAPAPALEPAEEARPAPSANEAAADPDADLPMLAQDFGDDPGRVLLVDDSAGSLATVSLRIARLGVDTHYASFVDEAHLFVNQEGAALRVLVAPPDIDLEQANEVVTAMAEQLGWRPPFLIVGEEPDAAQRAAIREAGVSSVLWAPFDDEELRFLVKSALSMPEGGVRDEKRVPLNQMATLRVDNRRESALLSSLSVRGAFFETANPPPVGTRLRIDFELAPDHFRLFGEVRYRQLEEASEGEEGSGGVGVTFYGVEEDAEHALRKAVEERAARYLP
jgi:CheY-like chemotaxis protein